MQTLMHNAMAGFDVKRDMEEFERSLPPGFRERIASVMLGQTVMPRWAPTTEVLQTSETSPPLDLSQARITILRAVALGNLTPEEAERLLFPK